MEKHETKKKSICSIVVTYNAKKWVDRCFSSLFESNVPTDVIAIDNGSSDDTVQHLKEFFPMVEVIQNEKNLGFGGANNMGMKLAYRRGYEYVFLVNQDAWVEQDTLGKLVEVFEEGGFGIVAPLQFNGEGSRYDSRFEKQFRKGAGRNIDSLDVNGEVVETKFVNAAFWMMSKYCLEKVGLFHPYFFHYGEDNNYCQRVRYLGLKVGVLSSAKAFHDREMRTENNHRQNLKVKLFRRLALLCFDPENDQRLWSFYTRNILRVMKFSLKKQLSNPFGLMYAGLQELLKIRRFQANFNSELLDIRKDNRL
ncbi:MAG: glycosyltransferase family 2 protein [Cyclobacteriaceae bacterium]